MWDSRWTSERVATLRALWVEGKSAREIAAQLGCTRNAVLGKLHRLGLTCLQISQSEKTRRRLAVMPKTRAPRRVSRPLYVERYVAPRRRRKPVKVAPNDPATLAAAALLADADAAERRREQWRRQPRGAAVG